MQQRSQLTVVGAFVAVHALELQRCGRYQAAQVRHWLATAAGVEGFIGFAVGRTTFWDAVVGWHAHTLTRAEAVAQIALRLRGWVEHFERARAV